MAEDVMDIPEIQRHIPHRYPFLLVDRILEVEKGRRIVGVKNVTMNEPFFAGHFPGRPIMPGVLLIEGMAQVGGVLWSKTIDLPREDVSRYFYFAAIDKVKFRRPVTPGDQLIVEAEAIRVKSRTGHVRCRARLGEALVAEAIIKFMMVDADPV